MRGILKISLIVRSKPCSRAERPDNFEENRAPVRGILKISLIVRLKLRSRAEHPRNAVDFHSYVNLST